MKGAEMMLASMLGLKSGDLQAKIEEFQSFVANGTRALQEIAETQQKILERLNAMEAPKNGQETI